MYGFPQRLNANFAAGTRADAKKPASSRASKKWWSRQDSNL
ncbi:MAG: hypothetical protein ACI4P6_00535 [Candidatus Spyradosoma sp.]